MVSSMFRLLLSMILGMVVGAERKRKGQVAGIRTFALISMGACLAMLLSIYVPQVYLGLKNGDPGRIAAQVITGIGFIGGGAMIHMKGSCEGFDHGSRDMDDRHHRHGSRHRHVYVLDRRNVADSYDACLLRAV